MPEIDQIYEETTIQRIPTFERTNMEDMLENTPGWLLHSGISIAGVVVAIALLLSWFIHYPDKLTAPVVLESAFPPLEVIAPTAQRLENIVVNNGTVVQKAAVLAITENAADYAALQQLDNLLAKIANSKSQSDWQQLQLPTDWQLGDLQTTYATLLQSVAELQDFLQRNDTQAEVATLQRELKRTAQLQQSLQNEATLKEKELAVFQKDVERSRSLQQTGAVSSKDLEQSEMQWLQYQRERETQRATQLQNQIRQEQLSAQQQQLWRTFATEFSQRRTQIQQLRLQLSGELERWKKNYLLVAPAAGRVNFAPNTIANRYFTSGTVLFTILPTTVNDRKVARFYLPADQLGKVEVNAPVRIELAAYPAREFGVINTQVNEVALLPQQDNEGQFLYHLQAQLPDTLRTTYGKVLPFQQRLSGQATVLTEDKRILERLFAQILDLVRNR